MDDHERKSNCKSLVLEHLREQATGTLVNSYQGKEARRGQRFRCASRKRKEALKANRRLGGRSPPFYAPVVLPPSVSPPPARRRVKTQNRSLRVMIGFRSLVRSRGDFAATSFLPHSVRPRRGRGGLGLLAHMPHPSTSISLNLS